VWQSDTSEVSFDDNYNFEKDHDVDYYYIIFGAKPEQREHFVM